jgi:hypothetical protein
MSAREKAKLPRQTGLRLYLFLFPSVDKARVSDHALSSPDAFGRRCASLRKDARVDERTREYQRSLASMTNQAAAQGQAMLGGYDSELLRIGIAYIRVLACLKVETEIAAYDRGPIRFDEKDTGQILQEAIEYSEAESGHLARTFKRKPGGPESKMSARHSQELWQVKSPMFNPNYGAIYE